jgi:hypothetical protein
MATPKKIGASDCGFRGVSPRAYAKMRHLQLRKRRIYFLF